MRKSCSGTAVCGASVFSRGRTCVPQIGWPGGKGQVQMARGHRGWGKLRHGEAPARTSGPWKRPHSSESLPSYGEKWESTAGF